MWRLIDFQSNLQVGELLKIGFDHAVNSNTVWPHGLNCDMTWTVTWYEQQHAMNSNMVWIVISVCLQIREPFIRFYHPKYSFPLVFRENLRFEYITLKLKTQIISESDCNNFSHSEYFSLDVFWQRPWFFFGYRVFHINLVLCDWCILHLLFLLICCLKNCLEWSWRNCIFAWHRCRQQWLVEFVLNHGWLQFVWLFAFWFWNYKFVS